MDAGGTHPVKLIATPMGLAVPILGAVDGLNIGAMR
jgi:hypothetical protein